jgi:hypothetical protein
MNGAPNAIVPTEPEAGPSAGVLPADAPEIAVGQWYWVHDPPRALQSSNEIDPDEPPPEPTEAWLGCVTRVGSNYAEITNPVNKEFTRIHLREFDARCWREPDSATYIDRQIKKHQHETLRLMGQVRELAAHLSIPLDRALPQQASASALAVRTSTQPADEYKQALVLAKDTTLPALFEAIRESNEAVTNWMTAPLVAIRSEVRKMQEGAESVADQIFNVELYAGLVENVVQIRKGKPAKADEKIHLLQRRAYMDEECLANYEAGGMRFKNLRAFDRWIARPDNFKRILPFERAVIAFQVRRHDWKSIGAERPESLFDFFRIMDERKLDKLTFLYLRNGEQLFRLETAIDFGEQLFPDIDRTKLDGVLYAQMRGSDIQEIITEAQHLGHLEELKNEEREIEHLPKEDQEEARDNLRRRHYFEPDHVLFSPETVYYDDITAFIQQQIKEHNRLVLVLQGILDRSPVFLPHPPWSLWTTDGFRDALELVYDDARALVAGPKPDFEAYRARLNASIQPGSVTLGQEDYWEFREAEKENERRSRNWRNTSSELTRYRPHRNPGPGEFARVIHVSKKTGECIFEWKRPSANYGASLDPLYSCRLKVPSDALLHIDAYRPGDFRQFFDDPRTRAEYLKWAPLLLAAEDYHAGKRKIDP